MMTKFSRLFFLKLCIEASVGGACVIVIYDYFQAFRPCVHAREQK